MKILVLGGSKSGKSHIAQEITDSLAQGGTKYYWATMEPVDEEDSARIEKHITDRDGWGFETIECGRNICSKLPVDKNSSVLFDCNTINLFFFIKSNSYSRKPFFRYFIILIFH